MMRPRLEAIVLVLSYVVAVALFSAPASAQSVVEKLIAAENPCAPLKKKTFLGKVGIDKLRGVHLDQADILLQGDTVKITVNGELACGTSNHSVVQGDASASITALATADIAQCNVTLMDVSLGHFGGAFGDVIAALSHKIKAGLEKRLSAVLIDACHRLHKLQ